MAKDVWISEELVRTRLMRVRSEKLNESPRRGFIKRTKPQKRLCANILTKKGAGNG